jgi:hypothetical protein
MATTPTTTTTTPPSTPIILNIDYLNDSWCELQYKSSCSSTGSISHLNHTVNPEVLEKLLQEAQRESTSNFFPLFKNPTANKANSNNLDEFDPSSSVNMISDILSSPSSLSSTKNVNISNNNDSCCRNNKISCSNMSSSQQDISCSANTIKMAPDAIRINEQNLDNDGDDDLDLEYMEEDDGVVGNNASSNSSHDSTDSNIIILNKSQKLNENVNNCDQCKHCSDHKKQIELLIEKQIFSEKQLIKLRKEYEDKLLMSKSLSISSTSSYSATSTPPSLNITKNTGANINNSNLTNNLINNETNLNNNNNNDWMKYWSSRPQINPPK